MILRTLLDLKLATTLGQLDVDISVRSARRGLVLGYAALLGMSVAASVGLVPRLGPSGVLLDGEPLARGTLMLACAWVMMPLAWFVRVRSWIADAAGSPARAQEFALLATLGADVHSVSFLEQWGIGTLAAAILAPPTVAALLTGTAGDLVVLLSALAGALLLAAAGSDSLVAHLSGRTWRRHGTGLAQLVLPVLLGVMAAVLVRTWRARALAVAVDPAILAVAALVALATVGLASASVARLVRRSRGVPLGLPGNVHRPALPRSLDPAHGTRRGWLAVRLLVLGPVVRGAFASRWLLAVSAFMLVGTSHVTPRALFWAAPLVLSGVLQTVSVHPDLVTSGRAVRFYYEERGGLLAIVLSALLSRCAASVPAWTAVTCLWVRFGAGSGADALLLSAAAVAGSLVGSGVAGSGHRGATELAVAMSGFVAVGVGCVAGVLLAFSRAAAAALVALTLVTAYVAWRRNVSCCTED